MRKLTVQILLSISSYTLIPDRRWWSAFRTVLRCLGRFEIGLKGELVKTANNNRVKIVWLKKT